MFNLLIEWFRERSGRAQAEREIGLLAIGAFTPAQRSTKPNPRLVKEWGVPNPYAHGYEERWHEEGYKDASCGRCRSSCFKTDYYEVGWIEGMRERHKQGFRHESLEEEYVRLVRNHSL
jgi:ribosome modulation factor